MGKIKREKRKGETMGRLFTLLGALALILSSCQEAEYDAFRFGPDPGDDSSIAPEQLQRIE